MKKILAGIGILFGIIFLLMLLMVGVVTVAGRAKGERKEVLPGKGDNPKKALIIYQPALTKITTQVAQKLAAGLNEGGYEVTLNRPGAHLTTDLSGYDLVALGSPTYAGQFTKALNNYLAQICPQLVKSGNESPRIVLFATGGVDEMQEFDHLGEMLTGVNVVKKVKFLLSDQAENAKKAYDLGVELAQ